MDWVLVWMDSQETTEMSVSGSFSARTRWGSVLTVFVRPAERVRPAENNNNIDPNMTLVK